MNKAENASIIPMQQPSTIYVTRPYLPPLQEFLPYLERIWQNSILTNGGPFHQQLEKTMASHLGVEHLSLFTNGTLALVTALQALRITGEVITTPYSFVATAHALLWNSIKPVFVDIEKHSMNIDPRKIEAAITPQTTAIVPVHCYGRPCNTEAIQEIADAYNLKVIYDAAHAFDVMKNEKSILLNGDMSVLSFHATKVFNTFEGGAIVCHSAKEKQRIDHLKNFGFIDEVTVVAPGINGKMSEINAAFGLLQLQHLGHAVEKRDRLDSNYRRLLHGIRGISFLPRETDVRHNFSYFPIRIEREFPISRDELYNRLRENGIHARRYFYPLISEFPMYRGLASASAENLPVASEISKRILCLPLYPALSFADQERIAEFLRTAD